MPLPHRYLVLLTLLLPSLARAMRPCPVLHETIAANEYFLWVASPRETDFKALYDRKAGLFFHIRGGVDEDGVLTFSVRTLSPGGKRNPFFTGKEAFDAMMKTLKPRVKAIVGSWSEDSDNLTELNRLTGPPSNLTPEAAAALTWTGKRAAGAGFPRVTIERLRGEPGGYTRAVVRFDPE